MALFTDQIATTIQDLKKYESTVLDLANSEGIDLNSKLLLANEEIGLELSSFLDRRSPGSPLAPNPASTVVVSDALRHWCALHSLAVLYRDLYSSQLNDRYLPKWREYEKLARLASSSLLERGIGIVTRPIARAAKPQLTIDPAPGAPPVSYYVAVAWTRPDGAEGLTSEIATADLEPDLTITVYPGGAPKNADSWNVYIGRSPSEMRLQNTEPISKTQTWSLPAAGLAPGRLPGIGQAPDYIVRQTRVLPRG